MSFNTVYPIINILLIWPLSALCLTHEHMIRGKTSIFWKVWHQGDVLLLHLLNPLVHVDLAWVCVLVKGGFDIFQEVASLQRLCMRMSLPSELMGRVNVQAELTKYFLYDIICKIAILISFIYFIVVISSSKNSNE